jgi:hypothetical protein
MTQVHGRVLLHLQAERVRAGLLAAGGDWPATAACFSQTMAQATKLDLPLEIARIQADWGQAMLRFAPSPGQGYALLNQAHQVFAEHQAAADLDALKLQPEYSQSR